MIKKDPNIVPPREFYRLLSGAVSPRPIALVSSCDKDRNVNLAPFSFFNVMSIQPPILVFSPLRRLRDKTTKNTLDNVLSHDEVVINIVGFDKVEQMSLAGGEYPVDVNEFNKSGFTPVSSEKVTPPRVKEAFAQFECKVKNVISLGEEGGAGNLVICEILLAHFHDDVVSNLNMIDPNKVNPIGRLGGDFYIKGDENSLFEIEKRSEGFGVGFDALPRYILNSKCLTGNEIGKLASVSELPDNLPESIPENFNWNKLKSLLVQGNVADAWDLFNIKIV